MLRSKNVRTPAENFGNVGGKLKNPINSDLREKALRIIACQKSDGTVNWCYWLQYNLLIPLVFSLIGLVYSLFKLKWVYEIIWCQALQNV